MESARTLLHCQQDWELRVILHRETLAFILLIHESPSSHLEAKHIFSYPELPPKIRDYASDMGQVFQFFENQSSFSIDGTTLLLNFG